MGVKRRKAKQGRYGRNMLKVDDLGKEMTVKKLRAAWWRIIRERIMGMKGPTVDEARYRL